MTTYNIRIDIHKIILVIVLGIIGVSFIFKLEKIILIIENSKEKQIITQEQEVRETIRHKYSYEKAKLEKEHKDKIEILNLMQKFEDSNRAMTYENDYQLKKIEFKGTVFETCSQYYEKSVDFIGCVKNILRNDLYNKE